MKMVEELGMGNQILMDVQRLQIRENKIRKFQK
jgi:hypothetical protein